jgi:hypothetical protein
MTMSTIIENGATIHKPTSKEDDYSGGEKPSNESDNGEPHHMLMESYEDHDV